ncbi:hypothetical protein TSAR_014377 [Trichomalopsis sarcophagae]|uniref:Uncharacterized protein n=1 Tax=Trichomalopsis sarcophagae TaxID=543379 RepID=A0A232EI59_9HYME|nr:hypothetical protein TSAR_014377 [Trichomalopsis sarcophagae]
METEVQKRQKTGVGTIAKIRKSRLFVTKGVLICTVRLAHKRSECDKHGAGFKRAGLREITKRQLIPMPRTVAMYNKINST